MIGIIGAMEQEVNAIKAHMTQIKEETNKGYTISTGFINNKEVALIQGGIGKVNATISASLLLDNYSIDYLINIGSAGGLDVNNEVGDIVVSTEVVHHDVDVTAFGRSLGEVPGMPQFFKADQTLVTLVEDVLKEEHRPFTIGLIASGDQFISSPSQFERVKKDFPSAICVEMEAASVAQTCHIYQTPFIIVRSLSDIYQKGDNNIQFDEYIEKASVASAKLCADLIAKL